LINVDFPGDRKRASASSFSHLAIAQAQNKSSTYLKVYHEQGVVYILYIKNIQTLK